MRPTALGSFIFAGGFSLGVKRHFEIVGHFEGDAYGVASARANQEAKLLPRFPIFVGPEAWPWDAEPFRSVDFVYGNPPCAAWSPLGPRTQRGLDAWRRDPRVDCARTLFNLLELIRPKVWAWESVPQAFMTGRDLVDHFTRRAFALGYDVSYVLHNAMHLGARQSRRRFFFVAHRVAIDWRCPFRPCPSASQALSEFPGAPNDEGFSSDNHYPRDFLELLPPGAALRSVYPVYLDKLKRRYGELDEARRKKLAPRPSFGDRRLPDDRPAGAIVDPMQIHPTEHRYLTLGEMKWLGGYPLEMVLVGNGVDQKAYQLTRAVLPPVGEWLASNVARALKRDKAVGYTSAARRAWRVDFYKLPGRIEDVTPA